MGCSDRVDVVLSAPDDTWAAGTYTLRVAFDDEELRCTTVLPDAPRRPEQRFPFECEPPIKDSFKFEVYFNPKSVCTETRTRNAVSESCTPVPDKYTLEFSRRDLTPRQVSVALERDGVLLVEETHTLSYRDFYPNGPDCDLPCHNAELTIELP